MLLDILKHCVTYDYHTMTDFAKKIKRWRSNPSRSECHSVAGISSNISMGLNANAALTEEAMGEQFLLRISVFATRGSAYLQFFKICLHFFLLSSFIVSLLPVTPCQPFKHFSLAYGDGKGKEIDAVACLT